MLPGLLHMKSLRLGVMDDLLNSLSEMYIGEAFF